MKKKITGILITLVLLLSFTAIPVFAATVNVPPGTIQGAINAAFPGDTIIVASGTYTEDLTINKGLTIQGVGTPTINGVHVITADNVTLDGFELTPGANGVAVTIDSSSSAIANTTITNCTFTLESPGIGVWIGGLSPTNAVSSVVMSNNIFNGPADQISNPWKIGGWFGTPISCVVSGVEFVNNTVDSGSIPINLDDGDIDGVLIEGNTFTNTDGVVYVWGDGDPDGQLSDFVFTGNDVGDTNSYGVGIDVEFDTLVPVFDDDNFGDGNRINYNNFYGIAGAYNFDAVTINSDVTFKLDATKNWWGHASGPSGDEGRKNGKGKVIGKGTAVNDDDVDWDPWLPQPMGHTKHYPVPPGLE